MLKLACLVLALGLAAAETPAEIACDGHSRGTAIHEEYCDAYYECDTGELKYCPSGLAYNSLLSGAIFPCGYFYEADCYEPLYADSQPKQAVLDDQCDRSYGIYPHLDPKVCDVYYECKEGTAYKKQCTTGLHYDLESGQCVWPAVANRGDCSYKQQLDDGFECPDNATDLVNEDGTPNANPNPTYFHPTDCQLFYICLNGVTPQKAGCTGLTVFNDVTGLCDDPANVPGCEDWFGDEDEDDA